MIEHEKLARTSCTGRPYEARLRPHLVPKNVVMVYSLQLTTTTIKCWKMFSGINCSTNADQPFLNLQCSQLHEFLAHVRYMPGGLAPEISTISDNRFPRSGRKTDFRFPACISIFEFRRLKVDCRKGIERYLQLDTWAHWAHPRAFQSHPGHENRSTRFPATAPEKMAFFARG